VQPTERFSSRVENYVKYRPGYPDAILDTLRAECGLTGDAVIADIGSGTGILAEMFLKNGNPVYGVEPNREMREAGERLLVDTRASPVWRASRNNAARGFQRGSHHRRSSRVGSIRGNRSGIPRILAAGWVVILWNDRRDESPFMQAYRQLLPATPPTICKWITSASPGCAAALRSDFLPGGRSTTTKFSTSKEFAVLLCRRTSLGQRADAGRTGAISGHHVNGRSRSTTTPLSLR
jgi:hypothetical protein